jgi:DNA-binding IclR family transcriptional regulator
MRDDRPDSPRMKLVLQLLADGERWHVSEITKQLGLGQSQTRLALIALAAQGRLVRYNEDVGTSTPRHVYQVAKM